jgi:protein TonB
MELSHNHYHQEQGSQSRFKSQFPSLGIVAILHVVFIGLALQSSGVISLPIPTVTTIDFKEPIPKPIEPEPIPKEQVKLDTPPITAIPTPIVPIEPTPNTIKLPTIGDQPTEPPTIIRGGTNPEISTGGGKTHAPIKLAAVVDAKACEKPVYPNQSLRNQEEGTVHLSFLIGIHGEILESRVDKTSGYKALDRAAIAGLSLCKFTPASTDGVSEKAWAKMHYTWTID